MTFTFAVTGKGGWARPPSQRSIRHIHEATKEVVLAVDADPNANLGAKLGTEPAKTLGGIREDMLARGRTSLRRGSRSRSIWTTRYAWPSRRGQASTS